MIRIGRADATGSTTSLGFSNIPGTFTDLCIKFNFRSSFSGGYFTDSNTFTVNGSNSGYSWVRVWNVSSSGGSAGAMSFNLLNGGLTTANSFANGEMYISNYTSNSSKRFLWDGITSTATTVDGWYGMIYTGSWSGTAPITSITFSSGSGNFITGSFIELYGIAKGSVPGVTVS